MIIEILDGVWLNPRSVTVIKKIDENSCALWVRGQSAMDGFVFDYPVGEVAEAVNDACDETEYEDEDEEESD
jgi:hypothetical protein